MIAIQIAKNSKAFKEIIGKKVDLCTYICTYRLPIIGFQDELWGKK